MITGVDAAMGAMERVQSNVRAANKAAVVAAAKIVVANAKGMAPHRSGKLARSIRYTSKPVGSTAYMARIKPTAPYANRIEQGFHGRDRLGRKVNAPAFPYMRPAAIESQAEIAATFTNLTITAVEL